MSSKNDVLGSNSAVSAAPAASAAGSSASGSASGSLASGSAVSAGVADLNRISIRGVCTRAKTFTNERGTITFITLVSPGFGMFDLVIDGAYEYLALQQTFITLTGYLHAYVNKGATKLTLKDFVVS